MIVGYPENFNHKDTKTLRHKSKRIWFEYLGLWVLVSSW